MGRWDITGTWAGEFAYGPGTDAAALPPVPFSLEARRGWLGRFRGTARTRPPGSPPLDPAAVRGRVEGPRVTFHMYFPVYYLYAGDRVVTLREGLAEQFGLALDADVPARPMWYDGAYDPVRDEAAGTWYMHGGRLRFCSGGQLWACDRPAASGTWAMRRDRG